MYGPDVEDLLFHLCGFADGLRRRYQPAATMTGTVIVGAIGSIYRFASRRYSTGYGTGGRHGNLLHFWHGALVRSSVVRAAFFSRKDRNDIFCFVSKQQFSIYTTSGTQAKNNSSDGTLCTNMLIKINKTKYIVVLSCLLYVLTDTACKPYTRTGHNGH